MIERLNSLTYAAAILFGVFGLILTYIARNLERWPRRLCICFLTSASVKIILVELYLMAEFIQRYQEQQEEMVRQRTQVAILQMRPHLLSIISGSG